MSAHFCLKFDLNAEANEKAADSRSAAKQGVRSDHATAHS